MSDLPSNQAADARGLTSVVFTDIVGYSARMGRDETGTIALVRADFERMRTLCSEYDGEILNTMGDGMLMCFSSVVHAVQFALHIQREFRAQADSAGRAGP